jgi:hypothetical protein
MPSRGQLPWCWWLLPAFLALMPTFLVVWSSDATLLLVAVVLGAAALVLQCFLLLLLLLVLLLLAFAPLPERCWPCCY